MGKVKKKRDHKAKVAKRRLNKEIEAWWDFYDLTEAIKAQGYSSIEEAVKDKPELIEVLMPFAERALESSKINQDNSLFKNTTLPQG